MPRSNWLQYVAAIGIALVTASGVLAHAPHQKRFSAPSSTAKESSPQAPTAKPYPTENSPLPVRIIEGAADTKHAQAREAKADEHDAEDLETQKRAIDVTKKQILPSWVGAFLTFLGTLLIVWSLAETRSANVLARQAIGQSEDHAKIELRAYVSVKPIKIEIAPVLVPGASIIEVKIDCNIRNTGNTPAQDIQVGSNILVVSWPPDEDAIQFKGTVGPISYKELGKDVGDVTRFSKLIVVDFARIKSGRDRIILVGSLSYKDVWGIEHPARFEGSLIEMTALITACEAYVPGSGPLTIDQGAKFEWYHPAKLKPQTKISS